MQAMKGATGVLGSMNRSMNLPALQRIAMEFEKENDIMDQRQEMMDDAIDDVTGLEDEAEGEEVVEQVLEEIGIDLKNAVGFGAPAMLVHMLIPVVDGRDSFRTSKHYCAGRSRCASDRGWRRSWGDRFGRRRPPSPSEPA